MHPMELLGDVGHVESHFFLFGDSVSVGARLTHPMELQGAVGHLESRSVRLEMEFALVQCRCTVCAICTIGSDIV